MQDDAIPRALTDRWLPRHRSRWREEIIEVAIETTVAMLSALRSRRRQDQERSLARSGTSDPPCEQTWLIWHTWRFTCGRCCRTFTKRTPEIPPRSTHTLRFDRYLSARGRAKTPFAHVADEGRSPTLQTRKE
jgi:hypothetical protein